MKFSLKKLLLCIVVALTCKKLQAQSDIILTIKGERITCFITKEDSARVYFKVGSNLSSVEASLLRSEIKSIEYANRNKAPLLQSNPGDKNPQLEQEDYAIEIPPTPIKKNSDQGKNAFFAGLGFAKPTGKFSNGSDTNYIGPGKNGYLLRAGFVHHFHKNVGFDVNVFYTQNEWNSLPAIKRMESYTDSVWKANKAYWKAIGLQIGFIIRKEIQDFDVYARVSGGYTSLKYPQAMLRVSSKYFTETQSVNADAISLSAGTGVYYKILETVDVFFHTEIYSSTHKFKEILYLGERPGGLFVNKTSITKRDVRVTYSNLFSILGLRYRF